MNGRHRRTGGGGLVILMLIAVGLIALGVYVGAIR